MKLIKNSKLDPPSKTKKQLFPKKEKKKKTNKKRELSKDQKKGFLFDLKSNFSQIGAFPENRKYSDWFPKYLKFVSSNISNKFPEAPKQRF